MKNRNLLSLYIIIILTINGCATTRGPNEDSGMIIGGLIGGVIGHQIGDGRGQTVATVIGAIVGTTIGGNVGRSMDDNDRLKFTHSLETVRTGVATSWNNPDTDYYYQVVPTRTFDRRDSPCREYQIEATVGGNKEMIYGTACRQADGSWEVE